MYALTSTSPRACIRAARRSPSCRPVLGTAPVQLNRHGHTHTLSRRRATWHPSGLRPSGPVIYQASTLDAATHGPSCPIAHLSLSIQYKVQLHAIAHHVLFSLTLLFTVHNSLLSLSPVLNSRHCHCPPSASSPAEPPVLSFDFHPTSLARPLPYILPVHVDINHDQLHQHQAPRPPLRPRLDWRHLRGCA